MELENYERIRPYFLAFFVLSWRVKNVAMLVVKSSSLIQIIVDKKTNDDTTKAWRATDWV